MFKVGNIVEIRFSPYQIEICEITQEVVRGGELRYQVRYPYNGSSNWNYTEVDAKDLKLSVYDKFKREVV